MPHSDSGPSRDASPAPAPSPRVRGRGRVKRRTSGSISRSRSRSRSSSWSSDYPSRSPSGARRQSPSHFSRSPAYASPRRQDSDDGRAGATVYVGNLPDDDTGLESLVTNFFELYGTVLHTKLIYGHESNHFRGFGFITFERSEDAETAAREGNNAKLQGKALRCNLAKYRQQGRSSGRPPYRYQSVSPPQRYTQRSPSPVQHAYRRDLRARSPRSRSRGKYGVSPSRKRRRGGSFSPVSLSRSPSPDLRRRRSSARPEDRDSPTGEGSLATTGSQSAQTKELKSLRLERDAIQAELKRTKDSLKQQAEVINKIHFHSQNQRTKMKALTARSQKRGQYMLSLTSAVIKMEHCRVDVKKAESALASAGIDLQEIATAAQEYAEAEEEAREAEDEKKKSEAAALASNTARHPTSLPASTDHTGPNGLEPGMLSSVAAPSGSGFNLKPFKISLAD